MSLAYSQIEAMLIEGVYFGKGIREFAARADPKTDNLVVTELSAMARDTLPLDLIMDRANAGPAGSDLVDVAALQNLLRSLV